jgi:hypothetical protein
VQIADADRVGREGSGSETGTAINFPATAMSRDVDFA